VTLIVKKTGQGIDASNKERLFNPKLATGRTAANTDLRLASVYAVVTQSGGHVDVHAEPGKGTEFKLSLPVVDAANVIQLPTKRRASASLDGTEVVLVVEDDVNVRRLVREALERHGYTVFEAENGVEALRMIAMFDSPPDLLLTDLVMPRLSGGGLIEALKLKAKLPKILLMSAHTDSAVLQRAAPPDKYPFIKKPFVHQELADRVREVLDE
jgi:CheY-like chemotaxis protein